MERETGFEPATSSLEGWRSTAELFPHGKTISKLSLCGGEGRIRTSEAAGDRFTVCSLCPLGNLPLTGPDQDKTRQRGDSITAAASKVANIGPQQVSLSTLENRQIRTKTNRNYTFRKHDCQEKTPCHGTGDSCLHPSHLPYSSRDSIFT